MSFPNKLSKLFQKLSVREKIWLLIFAWISCAIWLTSCIKRTRSLTQDWSNITSKIKGFEFWIKNDSIIKNNLENVLNIIDTTKTYSGTQLTGQVESFAREHGLAYSISSPKTRQGEIFDAHTVQLHCEHASLDKLIAVEGDINKMKPYIGLEKLKLRANNFNPDLIEADFYLIALQLKDIKQ